MPYKLSSSLAPLKIQDLAEQDRPREKMVAHGEKVLSDAELFAILLGSGTRDLSALELAKQILKQVNHRLVDLRMLSLNDLKKFKGVGNAKAITILSALEIAHRFSFSVPTVLSSIKNSQQAYQNIKRELSGKKVEEFWLMLLNQGHKLIRKIQISKGGFTKTVVDPKVLFQLALSYQATYMILVHNHPSGILKPSMADILLTKRVKKGAEILTLQLLDHIIFVEKSYFSFSDEGMMS